MAKETSWPCFRQAVPQAAALHTFCKICITTMNNTCITKMFVYNLNIWGIQIVNYSRVYVFENWRFLCSIFTSPCFRVALTLVKVASLVAAEVKMGNWKEATKVMGKKEAIEAMDKEEAIGRRRRRMRQLAIGKGQRWNGEGGLVIILPLPDWPAVKIIINSLHISQKTKMKDKDYASSTKVLMGNCRMIKFLCFFSP